MQTKDYIKNANELNHVESPNNTVHTHFNFVLSVTFNDIEKTVLGKSEKM